MCGREEEKVKCVGRRTAVYKKRMKVFEDGMKQMWVGITGILDKRAGEADAGTPSLRAQNGKMVINSISKGGKGSTITGDHS